MRVNTIGIILMAIAFLTIPIYQVKAQSARDLAQAGLELSGSIMGVPMALSSVLMQIILNIVKTLAYDYLGGYAELVYYGIIRPVILDLCIGFFYASSVVLNLIGIIPIVSIPVTLINDAYTLLVLMPLFSAMIGYYPEDNMNPLAQGSNLMIGSTSGFILTIFEVVVMFLLIINTILMFIPFVNIIMAIVDAIIYGVVGVIITPSMLILTWVLNLLYVLPTICNYTPLVNLFETLLERIIGVMR